MVGFLYFMTFLFSYFSTNGSLCEVLFMEYVTSGQFLIYYWNKHASWTLSLLEDSTFQILKFEQNFIILVTQKTIKIFKYIEYLLHSKFVTAFFHFTCHFFKLSIKIIDVLSMMYNLNVHKHKQWQVAHP